MGNHFDLHFPSHHHNNTSSLASSPDTTSPTSDAMLSAKSHKHYQSPHVDTPYPELHHASTSSSSDSSGSFLDVKKHDYVLGLKHAATFPNPVTITSHAIEDHVAELRYGHISRVAKREARKSSQQNGHFWKLDAQVSVNTISEAEEVVEDCVGKDQKSWEAEMKKREMARKSMQLSPSFGWSGGWTPSLEDKEIGKS